MVFLSTIVSGSEEYLGKALIFEMRLEKRRESGSSAERLDESFEMPNASNKDDAIDVFDVYAHTAGV